MESLSQQLAELLTQAPQNSNLLQTEQILVQSPGMSTWLRLEVAKHNGIAAALDFPLPSSFIWQLCHQFLPDVPEKNAFTKPMMTWKIMSLLPHLLHLDEFISLHDYLSDKQSNEDSQQTSALKMYQLSNRIADIFDQYLVYRPEWIHAWENNDSEIELPENQLWQPILWRTLLDLNNNHLKQSHYHRANLHQTLLAALSDNNTSFDEFPKRLFVFGISSMPPQMLEVLHSLAQRIDVFMFNLSPCQHYWGDIVDPKLRAKMALQFANKHQLPEQWEDKLEVGNPILANNGKMGRELLDLLLELPEDNSDLSIESFRSPLNENAPSMLHGVQHDILEMETLGESLGPNAELYQKPQNKRILAKDDDSIKLVSCHSPLRELETLHNHLLAKLEANPKLQPKDIVIMLPDVASYAPYIDAVFSSKQGKHFIPYAIADRGAAQESPLVNSFLNLMSISQSRFSVSEIVSILEVSAVMRKFELDEDEVHLIKRWLNQAGIRWGRDGDNRQQLGLPQFQQNSWAFGLKRLILGYALSDDSPLYLDSLKVEGVEGLSTQALGKLLNFIEALDQYHQQFADKSTASERLYQLESLVEDFYLTTNDELPELQEVREAITQLKTELMNSGFDQPLDISILHSWFKSVLTESRVGQRYLAGNINFCTLMPMRSIPFQVVCLLGMNDGVYPRTQHPIGFDLMAKFPAKRGDRSRRLDDRYLFLEALLSARQQLYISYIGASERDNSERIPSMLVSELIEYCQLCYRSEKTATSTGSSNDILQQLFKQQPLQPFDPNLYLQKNKIQQSNTAITSYDPQWCPPTNKRQDTDNAFITKDTQIDNQVEKDELDISALIRFYRNPAQYFFNRSLNLDLNLNIVETENDEPFALNALERYLLQDKLIQRAIKVGTESIDEGFINQLKATGDLPVAPFDELLIGQYQKDITPLVSRCLFIRGDSTPTSLNLDLQLNGVAQNFKLTGRIDDVSAKGLINVRPGKAHGRDLIRLHIRHLAMNASGLNKHSFLLDISHYHVLTPIEPEQAKLELTNLINHYYQGLKQPLCFIPKTSFAYVTEDGDHFEKLMSAQKQWLDEQSQLGEGNDPHYQRLFTFPDDFNETEFGQTSMQILKPLLSHYQKDTLAELSHFVDTAILNGGSK